jgi:3-polyprenyl-4-hydroxybenzoate decarboxylase|tara:strand:+ start:193 stop:297 length:105 start_codon:yes stop_codon:yes gene_type:complete
MENNQALIVVVKELQKLVLVIKEMELRLQKMEGK